ncbi:MAG: hypothetical protein ABW003_12950 [Microvirga sp.]
MTRFCPWCKVPLIVDHKAMGAPRPPRDRDVTICDECHGVSVMHDGQWLVPTPDEQDDLMRDRRFLKALAQSIADAVERAKHEPKH